MLTGLIIAPENMDGPPLNQGGAPRVPLVNTLALHLQYRRAYNYQYPSNLINAGGADTALVSAAETNLPTRPRIISSRIPIVRPGFANGEQF